MTRNENMSVQSVVESLKGKFSASVLEVAEFRGETTVVVKKEPINRDR
jgi:hypothetical protein